MFAGGKHTAINGSHYVPSGSSNRLRLLADVDVVHGDRRARQLWF